MARKNTKRWLLIGGGVAILGAAAYYFYTNQEESQTTPPLPGPNPRPLPAPKTGPTSAAVKAYQDALAAYHSYVAYTQSYPPISQPDLDAAKAHLNNLRAKVYQAAAAIGVTPNV